MPTEPSPTSGVEKDTPSYQDTGEIKDVPVKDDVKTSKVIADEMDKINKDKIVGAVRTAAGIEAKPEPVGTMTKDAPQIVFRLIGGVIGCKKFELDDAEAATMAAHLNILIPLSGKVASLVIILMITLNKVYICLDAIKAKFAQTSIGEESEKRPDLPEPLS